MPCFSPCDYKKEVSLLKKELAALDPVRVKEKLAEAERCILRVTGERDRARTRNKELQKHIESLKYTNQSLNDRLEWTKEDLQKEVKEGKDAQKALKRKKDQLEKELSTAVWRLEKQKKISGRTVEKGHRR